MKFALACALLFVTVAVSHGALTCMTDKEKCAPEECCIQMSLIGVCKKRVEEDKLCEMKPVKHLFKDWVYKMKCPCAEDLKCVSSKGGLVGKFAGKCQASSSEESRTDEPKPVTEPEPAEE